MKHLFIRPFLTLFWVTLFFVTLSCGNNGSSNIEAGESAKENQTVLPVSDSTSDPQKQITLKKKISVKATGTTKDNTSLTINFTISPLEKIHGEFRLGSKKIEISGTIRGNLIRCWLAGTDSSDSSIWRGTLMGVSGNNGFAGDFIISNNAAEQTITGSWKQK